MEEKLEKIKKEFVNKAVKFCMTVSVIAFTSGYIVFIGEL